MTNRPMIRAMTMIVVMTTAVFGLPAWAAEKPIPEKVIIDDDGFTLMHMMLVGSPSVEVVGMTSVTGNLWAPRGAVMQLRGLEIMGRSGIPVAQGAVHPLLNTEKATERWETLYGKLTWKGAWMKQWVEPTLQSTPPYYGPDDLTELPWGAPATKVAPEMAAVFMIRMVRKYPGQITIVAGGPLTNLALAQRLDPEFAGLAKRLVYMGGSFNPQRQLEGRSAEEFAREFAHSPRREFNIRLDPEAASIVSRAPWKQITVVPVDPSTSTQLTDGLLARLTKAVPPAQARLIAGLERGFPLWDEIVAAVVIDPAIVTKREAIYVDYNIQFSAAYGDTLSWHEGYQPGLGEQKADVVLSVDPAALEELTVRAVASRP